jgi:hypothetical protein
VTWWPRARAVSARCRPTKRVPPRRSSLIASPNQSPFLEAPGLRPAVLRCRRDASGPRGRTPVPWELRPSCRVWSRPAWLAGRSSRPPGRPARLAGQPARLRAHLSSSRAHLSGSRAESLGSRAESLGSRADPLGSRADPPGSRAHLSSSRAHLSGSRAESLRRAAYQPRQLRGIELSQGKEVPHG